MAEDTRPTKAEFQAMPMAHKRALLKPTHPHPEDDEADPVPFTAESVAAFRAARMKRRAEVKKTRVAKVINGKSHTQQSTGIRRSHG